MGRDRGPPGVSIVMGLLIPMGVIAAFGAVANADGASKATLLAKGIAEALTCTPLDLLPAAVTVMAVFWLARRWNRRPPDLGGRP